jgi:hypothetical protein
VTASTAVVPAPTATAAATAVPKATDEERASWTACQQRRTELEQEPELPGAPELEKQRVQLARLRGAALLWRRVPKTESPVLDRAVAKSKTPLDAVKRLLRKNKHRAKRREIFLREGYLYCEDIEVGLALVEMIGLTSLHSEPKIHLQRGAQTYELKRMAKTRYLPVRYVYQNGPLQGETAEILFGDRVAVERQEVLQDPLTVDLQDGMSSGDFDRLRPVRVTAKALVADVRYGPDTWVPAVFDLDGPGMKLACEVLSHESYSLKQTFVAEHALHNRALAKLRTVIHQEVREQIPFDAAKDNENGFLREAWERAYFKGWRRFTHRERKYDVYNADGQPIPPQVCIDFVTDTWERAAGSWFSPLSGDPPKAHPERKPGPIDIEKFEDLKNRRSVAKVVDFTKAHPDLFDTWDLPKAERVPFKKREEFFDYLAKSADQFRPGDVIILHGYKEGGRPHYHTLMILEQDPITGVPIRVAGNAVMPREQTLEGIMQISPKRSIRTRIRLREPWLRLIAAEQPAAPAAQDDK